MLSRGLLSLLCASLAMLPACSLARFVSGSSTSDGAPLDLDASGLSDTGSRVDGGRENDAAVDPGMDAALTDDAAIVAIDAGTDAATSPDDAATSPDAATVDAATGPRSCTDIYGSVADYSACGDTPSSCEFVTTLYVIGACEDRCTSRGGTCMGAYNRSAGGGTCAHGSSTSCATRGAWDVICICSHPP